MLIVLLFGVLTAGFCGRYVVKTIVETSEKDEGPDEAKKLWWLYNAPVLISVVGCIVVLLMEIRML